MSQNIGNFFVQSKLGLYQVHRQTGLIHKASYEQIWPGVSLTTPLMFDIEGWKKKNWSKSFWNEPLELGVTIDIMTIGWWYRDKNGDIR